MSDTPIRRRPWGKIVLAVSLGLNLLIVGMFLSAFLFGHARHERGPGLRDLGFGPYVAALTRADRLALAGELRREGGPFREQRRAMRAQFEAFLAALEASPYDHDAVTGIVERQQGQVFESQRLARSVLLAHIAQMSDAERAAYAEALRREVRRGPRRGGRGGRD